MKKAGSIILLWFILAPGLRAQSSIDLKINEILVQNDSGYIDDFGQHSPWIEIFNTAFNYVDIGGCYLTNDPSNPRKYPIPKGDPLTRIAPRNYIVFWAANQPTHGIRHLNFDLRDSRFLALYDADGRTLIDSLSWGPQNAGISYGRTEDGSLPWAHLPKNTPNANNNTEPKTSAAQQFQQIDPVGIGLAAIAMSVVFLVLLMLFIIFKNFSNAFIFMEKRKEKKQRSLGSAGFPPDENLVAVGLAIHLYIKEIQEHEDLILTIKKVSRTYSPWSSKIYGIGGWPRH